MNINRWIYIILLICLFKYDTVAGKYNQYDLEKQLFDLVEREVESFLQSPDENSQDLLDEKYGVDPDDRVNVQLWNKINDIDIKNMPEIDDYSDETTATVWLAWFTRISLRYHQVGAHLGWNYRTNITVENEKAETEQSLVVSSFYRSSLPIAKKFNKYMKHSKNEDLKRVYGRLAQGSSSNNDEYVKKISKLHSELESIYSTAEVCEPNDKKKCYALSPVLERIMQTEKDYDRLLWAWQGWHDQCGNKIRPVYLPYIALLNRNVQNNGYQDLSESWIQEYEMGSSEEFESTLDDILQTMMPFYKQLHAFVRGRLCEIYPDRFDCEGPIPAHLLGNMWAQQWQDRLDDLLPYPDTPLVNVTVLLEENEFTVNDMYLTAEKFFTSIDLYPMTPKFWARSMFVKPHDRDVVCHASASNMQYHDDYRTKICTIVDDDYFYTIHHEMGHIEYYMAYKNQPFYYQDGANSAFHEAIGDTIGMYAISPPHLIKLGFIDKEMITPKYEINYLMRMALQKVAFLPFAYVMDKYRFKLFRNEINVKTELNAKWWDMRIKYGGIMPPVERHDPENFDAGAKYHIPSNVPYARYFIAHILQFQFYRALCRLQGHRKRIHMCDIYGNKDVGGKFKEMLAMGSSKPWSEILESLTGEDHLEPEAMLDYFEPLYQWLRTENSARGYHVGWT